MSCTWHIGNNLSFIAVMGSVLRLNGTSDPPLHCRHDGSVHARAKHSGRLVARHVHLFKPVSALMALSLSGSVQVQQTDMTFFRDQHRPPATRCRPPRCSSGGLT